MNNAWDIGRLFIIIGAVLIIIGLLTGVLGRLPFGRLPGDIVVRRGNFTFYFPLVTSIILSLLLTLILRIFRR